MLRCISFLLVLGFVFLQPCFASGSKGSGAATVINVAKSGAITIGQQRVKLKDLLLTLNKMGVTTGATVSVQGDAGAKFEVITRVLETLADGGLLPKDTID